MSDPSEPIMRRFRVALSFSGKIREYVEKVAEQIAGRFTRDAVLYDKFHEAEFARPDLAFYLPSLYADDTDLIVVAFDESYSKKEWCGLEWSATYSLIKSSNSDRIMLLRLGGTPPKGLFGLEGWVDTTDKSPEQTANLILERLAINERQPRDYYVREGVHTDYPPSGSDNSDPGTIAAHGFEAELAVIRRERAGKSRRRALLNLAARAKRARNYGKHIHVIRLNICRTLLTEARYFSDYKHAVEAIDAALHEMEDSSISKPDRIDVHAKAADVAVDIAQFAPPGIPLNSLFSRLNRVVSKLGHDIGVGKHRESSPEHLTNLLVSRSKCRRALCSLLRRRTISDRRTNNLIKTYKKDSLVDAQEAHDASSSLASSFELALSFFLNSGHFTSELSNQGLAILQELQKGGQNILVSYELIRQLRLRHAFREAADAFQVVAEAENDIRRFHGNLSSFSACVVGMYHCKDSSVLVKDLALKACNWLQDCINAEHHRASEVVDLCYMRAIAGFRTEDFVQPLSEFRADSPEAWNILAETAYRAASGETTLGDSLLLGLEDATTWNRIGTFFADFCGDYTKAMQFYDRAIRLNPHSPIYFFNKARVLAYKLNDFEAARLALNQCKSHSRTLWGWYKINAKEIADLEQRLIDSESRKHDA